MEYIKKSPCLTCDRKGCGAYHDECEKYLDYSEERNELNHKKMISKRNEWQGAREKSNAKRPKQHTAKALKRG